MGVMGLEQIGNYAIRLQFDDLHASGIYTWPFLYDLGVNKFQYMREYIKGLKRHGESREPRHLPRKAVK